MMKKFSINVEICDFGDDGIVGTTESENRIIVFSSDDYELTDSFFKLVRKTICNYEENDADGLADTSQYLVLISFMNNQEDDEINEYAALATNDYLEAKACLESVNEQIIRLYQ